MARLAAEHHLGRLEVHGYTVPQSAGVFGVPVACVRAQVAAILREEKAGNGASNGEARSGHAKPEHLRDQLRRLVERYGGTDALFSDLGVIEIETKAQQHDALPSLFDQVTV